MEVTIVGAGSFGIALSHLLASKGITVTLQGRPSIDFQELSTSGASTKYLQGTILPKSVKYQPLTEGIQLSNLIVVALPADKLTHYAMDLLQTQRPLLLTCKGLDPTTGEVPSVSLNRQAVSCGILCPDLAVLSGPNLAHELVKGVRSWGIVASTSKDLAALAAAVLSCSSYKPIVSEDMIGVQLCGAFKNVIAIGLGIADGMGLESNVRGALGGFGMAEIGEIIVKSRADITSLVGIAGFGDLLTTAHSKMSRNYRLGLLLGSGIQLAEAQQLIGETAEGISTAIASSLIIKRLAIEAPVISAITSFLSGRMNPESAARKIKLLTSLP